MADYSLRVKIDKIEIEAHATNPTTVAQMINQSTKKFLVQYTVYQKNDLNL